MISPEYKSKSVRNSLIGWQTQELVIYTVTTVDLIGTLTGGGVYNTGIMCGYTVVEKYHLAP